MSNRVRADLHIHTMASDGTSSADEVISEAAINGIKVISFTDHDSTANVLQGAELAGAAGIVFLNGIEVSTIYEQQYFHILGYGIDVDSKELKEFNKQTRECFESKDVKFIKNLIHEGYEIDFDEYVKYEHNPRRGGWKALGFLIDKGIVRDIEFFLQKYPPGGGILTLPELHCPEAAINVIKAAGGMAVLAHPGRMNMSPLDDILKLVGEMGIDGIECFHPFNDEATRSICLNWCKENKLLITGGSDYHGTFSRLSKLGIPDIEIGRLNLDGLLDGLMS